MAAEIGHARRHVVGASAQQISGKPERDRGHAIAVEQPVEDRRGADVATDDARVITDAQQHEDHERGSEPAQERQRSLLRDPGDARHHQREADREPSFLQRQGQRERQRRNAAGSKYRGRGGKPGPGGLLAQRFGGDRIERREQEREAGERDRAVESRHPVIESGHNGDRREHADRAPHDRNARHLRAALGEEASYAEQGRVSGAERDMPADIRQRRFRTAAGAAADDEQIECRMGGPLGHHQAGESRRNRHRSGRSVGAPGDRHGRHRQQTERRQGDGFVLAREHQQGCGAEIGAERSGRDGIDLTGGGRRSIQESGDDQSGNKREADDDMECMRAQILDMRFRQPRQAPHEAEHHRGDRKPPPQARACQRKSGDAHDGKIGVERPVIRHAGADEERRHVGADETEAGERRPMQERGRERGEGDEPEQDEGGGNRQKLIKRIGRKDSGVGDGRAGGGEDAGNVGGRQARDAGQDFLAACPFAGGDQLQAARRERRGRRVRASLVRSSSG
jgi:hypothetical protein